MKRSMLGVLIPFLAMVLAAFIVMLERYGVVADSVGGRKPWSNQVYSNAVVEAPECLIIKKKESDPDVEMIEAVLDGMRITYDEIFVSELTDWNLLNKYDKVVLAFGDWSIFGNDILKLTEWVNQGGHLMNVSTPDLNSTIQTISGKLGIKNVIEDYVEIKGLTICDNYMVGTETQSTFLFSEMEEETVDSSFNVLLSEDATVYVRCERNRLPIIWKKAYGKGEFAFINCSINEKFQRGFVALAYSSLGEACVYPVINGSVFYLDDFPSPVPEGNSDYIFRDYKVSTSAFYSTVWWPKVLEWEEKYNIKHTGLIIEQYSDQVTGPFDENRQEAQFVQFGNMLLNNGGELGFHGYNHMPLCMEGVDEDLQYGEYTLWPGKEEMISSLKELHGFAKKLFPEEEFITYVPPSDILSESGREALLEACPDVKIIAASYVPSDDGPEYIQEFDVSADGIINTPRITSGCMINNYQRLTALSELNFHYVQSHFMHPDDVLDEDRGAAFGWEKMSSELEKYLDWMNQSAPSIRNMTGREMGLAVEQYDTLSVSRTYDASGISISLGGFSEEAYLFLRVNEGKVTAYSGCEIQRVANNLYLIHAQKDKIRIIYGE